jgi:hypothetical protein
MDRKLWQRRMSETSCPPWQCPVCSKGIVTLVPKSLVRHETIESKKAHTHDAWEPDWIEYRFTAWGECKNPACKQLHAIGGTGGVTSYIDDEEGNYAYGDFFEPKFCSPMPEMIHTPAKCPQEVVNELNAAFALFWSSPAACAGRIRVAIECLMNDLGIPVKKKTVKGKYADLSLHRRIDIFAAKNPVIGQQLMALKWLGNSGSHSNDVSQTDILDAFEILEHSLDEIVEKRSIRITALAKKLTKAHKGKTRARP